MAGTPTRRSDRIPGLDGLRGIAAVAVMLLHLNFSFLPSANLLGALPIQRAYLAVDLFFLMSGYVMAHVYGAQMAFHRREAWTPFVIARISRLYPLVILTTSIIVVTYATGHLHHKAVAFSPSALLLQIFMLPAWYGQLSWNYPAWSISTELAAYAMFIFAARQLLYGRYPVVIAGGALASVAVLCKHYGALSIIDGAPVYLRTVIGFCMGVLVFRALRDYREATVIAAVIGIGPAFGAAYFTGSDFYSFCALVALVVIAVSNMLPILNTKLFKALGDWSYGIYLWHAPVSFALLAAAAADGYRLDAISEWPARACLGAVALLVIAVAALAYRYFELPAMRTFRASSIATGPSSRALSTED